MRQKLAVLFHRDFRQFQGGHLTFWNYFNHVRNSPRHVPLIHFSEESVWNETNPWLPIINEVIPFWQPRKADCLMLGGRDWEMLSPSERDDPPAPVINLILGIRHADPAGPYFEYLRHKAVRICVTEEIAHALRATGRARGPIFVNPHGFDAAAFPVPLPEEMKTLDILIVGVKRLGLAHRLSERLASITRNVEAITTPLPRSLFLSKLNRAKIAVCLPLEMEGSYRPPMEAMALRTFVICPRHRGNSDFYSHGWNCLRPDYTERAIAEAIHSALKLPGTARDKILENARHSVEQRTIDDERKDFLEILNELERL